MSDLKEKLKQQRLARQEQMEKQRLAQQKEEITLIVDELDTLRTQIQSTQDCLDQVQATTTEIRASVLDSKVKVDRMIGLLESRISGNPSVSIHNNLQSGDSAENRQAEDMRGGDLG